MEVDGHDTGRDEVQGEAEAPRFHAALNRGISAQETGRNALQNPHGTGASGGEK
jgi:hypothetical protein